MIDFKEYLENNEEIIYTCRAVPGKAKSNILAAICAFLLSIAFLMISITSLATEPENISDNITLILISCLVLVITIYSIYYNLVLHNKEIAEEHYCLTNFRAIVYNERTKEVKYGYLVKLQYIYSDHQKGNYGDLTFSLVNPKSHHDTHNRQIWKEQDFLIATSSKHTITFYSIENIIAICKLAQDTQNRVVNYINQNNA